MALSSDQREKLIQSTSAAFPLTPDPWHAVAFGLGAKRETIIHSLLEMQRDGLLLGFWGEPNPAFPHATEVLAAHPSETVRWQGGSTCSLMAMGKSLQGWQSREFKKAGLPLNQSTEVSDLLSPVNHRSYRIQEIQTEFPRLSTEAVSLADGHFQARPLDDSVDDFWTWLGAAQNLAPQQSQALARELISGGVWRRLALRYDLAACGYEGCGLAAWKLSSEAHLRQAAEALTPLAGIGDTVIREPDASGANLTALFIARPKGLGAAAAEEITRQWGAPMRWMDLALQ